MGINISVYKILGITKDVYDSPYCEDIYFKTEKHPTWDSVRYAGDRDFWRNEAFEWETRYDGDSGTDWESAYHRPKDLDKAVDWVKSNIKWESTVKRLVNILEEMKGDPNLYFRCSY